MTLTHTKNYCSQHFCNAATRSEIQLHLQLAVMVCVL